MDFTWRVDGTLLFACRENTGGSTIGNLYWATAAGNATTVSAPTLFDRDKINGVQPQLRTLLNGSLLLMTGDRTGSSSMAAGIPVAEGVNATGIDAWNLPAASAPTPESNWSYRQRVGTFFSTDGGQPWPVVLPSGEVAAPYYATGSVGWSPVIYACMFDATKL
jgi:hypothetical protein